jgi:hypothetical protein
MSQIALDLIGQPKPVGDRDSFSYYGKEIPIPEVGDIIRVSRFVDSYILVREVVLGNGKEGTYYKGNLLGQKGMETGMAPAFLKGRDDFQVTSKIVRVYPKKKGTHQEIVITKF